MYFSTGLFSKEDEGSGDVNPECALDVGKIIQQSLDGGCFTDKMSSKRKVKNLAHLRKPVKVSENSVTGITIRERTYSVFFNKRSIERVPQVFCTL